MRPISELVKLLSRCDGFHAQYCQHNDTVLEQSPAVSLEFDCCILPFASIFYLSVSLKSIASYLIKPRGILDRLFCVWRNFDWHGEEEGT